MISDYYHKWGLLELHYVQEYYWYARRSVDLILDGADDAQERVKGLEEEYSGLLVRIRDGSSYSVGNVLGICKRLADSEEAEDRAMAVTLARELANYGEPAAWYFMGICRMKGVGVGKNARRGATLLRTASDGGYAPARNKLFDVLWRKRADKYLKEALALAEFGSECGDGRSMLRLAWCYLDGKGVEKDLDKALYWTRKAAAAKIAGIQDHVMSTLMKIGTQEAYVELRAMAGERAKRGNGKAALFLSRMYYDGLGVPKNLEKSARLARRAARKDVPGARLMLFDALWAMGPSKHDARLLKILSEKELDGSADALWRKGLAHSYGRGVPEDKALGRELMEAAAAKNGKWESELKSMEAEKTKKGIKKGKAQKQSENTPT
jgi:TPR repeat protein